MKKTYKTPEMTVSLFDIEDIITASGASFTGVDGSGVELTGDQALQKDYVGIDYGTLGWE